MEDITEADAAREYAKAWNRLNPSTFLSLLADDAHFASQWVCEELKSKRAISDYFIGKIAAVKTNSVNDSNRRVYAELIRTTRGILSRDCVFLSQGGNNKTSAIILFEVKDGAIVRFDMREPELLGVVRSGVYPK